MFLKLFFTTIILDFLRFPIWWYTEGIRSVGAWAAGSIRRRETAVGLWVWAKNIFVPMYGQRDWQGRLVSFLFRVVFLVVRLFLMLGWVIWILTLTLAYCLWPIGAIAGFLWSQDIIFS